MVTIYITANTSWYIYNFRMGTIERLVSLGYKVITVAPDDEYKQKLENKGCRHYLIYMDKSTKNPFKDLRTLWSYYKVIKQTRPKVMLSFTPKCNIYGAIAARICDVKVITNIAGLGSVFVSSSLSSKLVQQLYKFSQKYADHVFFQNEEDMSLFCEKKMVDKPRCSRLPGSGVNLLKFNYCEPIDGNIKFILVSRMLLEKGIQLYVDAAKAIREKHPEIEFALLGQIDQKNPSGIPLELILSWQENGWIKYLGKTDNVPDIVKEYTAVVLPSYYREGVPRSLLEAGALGKPIITTNNVGCRETVIDEVSGFICEAKNLNSLIDKLEEFINLPFTKKKEMGYCSRKHIEKNFDEEIVINKYLERINQI